MWDHKCFICHKVGCHSAKHPGYPGGKRTPQRNSPTSGCFQKTNDITADPRVAAFLNRKDVTANQAMTILEVVFGAKEEGAKEWPTKEELVNQVSILKDV